MGLFDPSVTRGQATAKGTAQAGLGGAISGVGGFLTGIAGVGAVPAMLAFTAADLFKRIVTGTLMDPAPWSFEEPALPGETAAWYAQHPGSLEEARAQFGPYVNTLTTFDYGQPTWDLSTGEFIEWRDPSTKPIHFGETVTYPDYMAWYYQVAHPRAQPPPPAPPPSPPPAPNYPPPVPSPPPTDTRSWTPSAAAYEDIAWGSQPMSMISTGLGWLGGAIGDVMDFAGELLPIAQQTAPIWGQWAPAAAGILTGGQMQPSYAGGYDVSYPAAMPGGAPIYAPSVIPAFGIPGWDLAPPGSTPITPSTSAASVRLPSTVTVPYQTASGRQQYATYKNMGRPVLFSGDYAACKRVRKVASKAKRRGGR
jgi:hypothetical protein